MPQSAIVAITCVPEAVQTVAAGIACRSCRSSLFASKSWGVLRVTPFLKRHPVPHLRPVSEVYVDESPQLVAKHSNVGPTGQLGMCWILLYFGYAHSIQSIKQSQRRRIKIKQQRMQLMEWRCAQKNEVVVIWLKAEDIELPNNRANWIVAAASHHTIVNNQTQTSSSRLMSPHEWIWQCVKTLYPCSSHQNSWYMDVHPTKNGINRYWSIPIWALWQPTWVAPNNLSLM